MKKVLLLAVVLTGCRSINEDIDRYREISSQRNQTQGEILDRLQLCLWGSKSSESEDRRKAFFDAAFIITEYPTIDEVELVKQMDLKDIFSMRIENKHLMREYKNLTKNLANSRNEVFQESAKLEGESNIMTFLKWGIGILIPFIGVFLLWRYL